jgi:hypothetical protein
MGSGLNKKKKNQIGVVQYPENPYIPGTKEFEYYRWCIKNGIIIWPIGTLKEAWFIKITINGKSTTSPQAYSDDLWDKVYEYYKYYYDKYKND